MIPGMEVGNRVAWVCLRCSRYFLRAPDWPHRDHHGRDIPKERLVPAEARNCTGPAVVMDQDSLAAQAAIAAFMLGGHVAVDAISLGAQDPGYGEHEDR